MISDMLFKITVLFFALIGSGLFFGMTLPCLNGPFNILKVLREKIGKPFACPFCSFLWGVIIPGVLSFWVPIFYYVIIGALGWGVYLMHISGYQVFYQGMED